MPYLSDLLHRRVLDAGGDPVGHLKDLAVLPGERIPAVRWAILATGDGERILRWADLAIEPAHVRLRRRLEGLAVETMPDDALRLGRDLLDQECVDGRTAAAVRVNDVRLEETGGQLRSLGVDVGWHGLLRRIGVEGIVAAMARVIGRPLAPRLIPWDQLEGLTGRRASEAG